jgi:hypothetical protein
MTRNGGAAMNLDTFLSFCLVVGLALFGAAFQGMRRRWKSGRVGFFPTVAALGNALHALQEFTQPQVRYVIREQMDEAAEDDEDGGPEDPVAHLLLQARKIRRGRLTRPITARWAARSSREPDR